MSTTTTTDALMRLAEKNTSCSMCKGKAEIKYYFSSDGRRSTPCGPCKGTGEAALFPGLRKDCPCLKIGPLDGINHALALGICKPCYRQYKRVVVYHSDCQNYCKEGKVLADVDMGELLEEARKAGFPANIRIHLSGPNYESYRYEATVMNIATLHSESVSAQLPLPAFVEALTAAVEAKEVDK